MPAGLANATEDIVTYAAKALLDPRTENKRLIICPAANKASQNDLITLWERVSGQKLSRNVMTAEELDKQIQGVRRRTFLAKVQDHTLAPFLQVSMFALWSTTYWSTNQSVSHQQTIHKHFPHHLLLMTSHDLKITG